MPLWTPPGVDRELRQKTCEYTASVDRMVQRVRGVLEDFNKDLKRMDPGLELVFIPPNATKEFVDVVPGRYHVVRRIPDGPPTLIAIVGPNGEFAEPDSGLFEYLRRIDLWNGAARRDRERAVEEARRAAEKRREVEAEERVEEIRDRLAAATQTRVSMSRDSPWTQNASRNARRDAGNRKRKAA